MKLIKQVKLFYKEGTSDKVYEIDLCEISSERFAVNFRYGRRGNNLKEGTKTPEFVSLEKAQAIFDVLEMEKRNKGYQTEIQTFVELPVLNENEQDPKKKAILTRLEDAVLDRKSVFKTQWKTSRVIWKVAQLNIKEAEAFILKLATKGDELQLYSSIYAFRQLKTTRALDLLQSLTMNKKQPLFIRNLALLTILDLADETTQSHTINYILSILPPEVKYFLSQQNQTDLLRFYQDKIVSNEKLEGLSILYIIQEKYTFVKDFLLTFAKGIPCQAPFFQELRAIYKLSAFRHDAKMQTLLAYSFEKNDPFYFRTASLDPEAYHVSQYVSTIDQYIDLRKEYQKDNCRIAFSQFTKYYFQNDAVNHLNQLGLNHESKNYLSFAINALLQYDASDYTPAYNKLMSDYGEMNWTDRQYYFTKIHFPECSKLYLLTNILFGNDQNRQLSPKLEFYTHKSFYKSEGYIFNEAYAIEVSEIPKVSHIVKKEPFGSGLINLFKNIFSKPKPIEAPIIEDVPEINEPQINERLEPFPHHWDANPEAYIQLIIKAKLNIIVSFAYKNLKNHPAFDDLIKKLDKETILKSFYSPFTDAQKFAFDGLKQHETLFSSDPIFVAKVLNTKLPEGLDWAKACIDKQTVFWQNIDFILALVFNSNDLASDYINQLLNKQNFSSTLKNTTLAKAIAHLITLENNDDNNQMVTTGTMRLTVISASVFADVDWEVISDLLTSPLDQNSFLASEMIIEKTKRLPVPVEMIVLLLQDKHENIRENGLKLLDALSYSQALNYFESLLQLLNSTYKVVVQAFFKVHIKTANTEKTKIITERLLYCLIQKENFEEAHELFKNHLLDYCQQPLRSMPSTFIVKLLFAKQKEAQNLGAEMLHQRTDFLDFSLQQIMALGNHEVYRVRQWVWSFFNNNKGFVKLNKTQALQILDSHWDDTRAFAFHYFEENYEENDWDIDTLVGLVDSVRPDVENFGKNLIQKYFHQADAWQKIYKLSQHPTVNIQLFVTNYLDEHIKDDLEQIKQLDYFFRSVLTRVNQARVAKNRLFSFLGKRALISEAHAFYIGKLLDDLSALASIQDKAKCIDILTEIKWAYPSFESHLILKEANHESTI